MNATAAWKMVSGMESTVKIKMNVRKTPIAERKVFALILR